MNDDHLLTTPFIDPSVTSKYEMTPKVRENIESSLQLDFDIVSQPNVFYLWMSNTKIEMKKTYDKGVQLIN